MKTKLFLATVICVLAISCVQNPSKSDKSVSDAKLSSISLKFPDKNKDIKTASPEALKSLDGYRVMVAPSAGCAGSSAIDQAIAWEANKIESYKIRQGCDYNILVQLGALSSDKKSLVRVFFTNDPSGKGSILAKEKFQGQKQISFPVVVSVTSDGRSAGFGGTEIASGSLAGTGSGSGDGADVAAGPKINLETQDDSRCQAGFYFSDSQDRCIHKYHRLTRYHDPEMFGDFFGVIRFVRNHSITVCFKKGSPNVEKWGPRAKSAVMAWVNPLRSISKEALATEVTIKKEEDGCGDFDLLIDVSTSATGMCEQDRHPTITVNDSSEGLDVLTHEMGHAFGLEDIFHGPIPLESGDPNAQIFWPDGPSIMVDLSEKPQADDIKWLKRLYLDYLEVGG